MRGKVLRIRGGLVHLHRGILEGAEAKARGLEGSFIWEGGILNSEGRFCWFIVSELPNNIHLDADVELVGAFFKLWEYVSRNDKRSRAPVLIGKTLQVLPRKLPEGPPQLAWAVLMFFLFAGVVLSIIILHDRRERARFEKLRAQKRSAKLHREKKSNEVQ